MIETGKFRKDFYYRLSTDIIKVPTLYECLTSRPSDLKEHIAKEVQDILLLKKGDPAIEPEAERIYDIIAPGAKDYEWPGNVRELEQAVRRALLHNNFKRTETSSSKSLGPLPKFVEDMLQREQLKRPMMSAEEILSGYATYLKEDKLYKYSDIAKIMKCDHRTVKKHLALAADINS